MMPNAKMEHAAGSPIAKINRAWRWITAFVVIGAVGYKTWVYKTRLTDANPVRPPPGAFTGEAIEPAVRKSKYEGAGNSAMGRQRGDRFT